MRLNKLPIKTTNHFNINDIDLELDIPNFKTNNDYSILGDTSKLIIKKEKQKKELSTKIGITYKEYQELNITIPKNVKVDEAILIDYAFIDDDSLIDRIVFNYEENSSCNFIITYISKDDNKHFHSLLETTKSSKSSIGNITYINLMNDESTNMISIENDVYNKANITHNIIDIGGNIRLYNVYSNLLEESATNSLNNIYIGTSSNIIDMNYYLQNTAKNTVNNMRVEGYLNDNSKKNFRGTIDFISGCSNSIGEENENCILLSDTCISRSLPQMLCGEENVVGTHGVSSGTVDKEKLFYLMSRGISKKDSEKLIIMSKFNQILNNIPSEEIIKYLTTTIEELLTK